MLPGVYDPGDVIDASLSIFVDGVEREHLSQSGKGILVVVCLSL